MNAMDLLALARFTIAALIEQHPLQWEDVPELDEDTFRKVRLMVDVIALGHLEQAGERGGLLYEATQ